MDEELTGRGGECHGPISLKTLRHRLGRGDTPSAALSPPK